MEALSLPKRSAASHALPFAQPPNVMPATRSLVCYAQRSVAALRGVLPYPSTRPAPCTRARQLCMSSPQPGDDKCESEEMVSLLDRLMGIVVPIAVAREDSERPGELTATLPDTVNAADPELMLRYPAVERIVAIGDVHGDMNAFGKSLRAAGVVDENGDWAGGKTVLVQVGDQLDRGDDERQIYDTLFRLQDTAPASGGAVHILLGNHELINVGMDYRYVTEGGFADFQRDGGVPELPKGRKMRIPGPVQKRIKQLPRPMQARARALSPGGPLAVELARRAQVAVIVGENVFVHGGLSPRHLTFGGKPPSAAPRTLQGINEDCRDYMLGVGKRPQVLRGSASPVWMRDYSNPRLRPGSDTCRMLAETLKMLRVKRMIVGHTPQDRGINAACSGRVWRIDTGMSAVYGGVPEAIEISKRGHIRVFTQKGTVEGSARARMQ